jgi:crotonobetainyl-CoA:carnitine CoA-transferase CaiB-like acyl-CoA transferase
MLAQSLAGLRVLDFTQVAAGPSCAMMLGDLGADVIKIESPEGDLSRRVETLSDTESITFIALNRNKRSVVLDLKQAQGRAHALALALRADVLVHSFRPGVMQRFGLDAQTLQGQNPALVYCAISAYGQEGPNRDLPGVDGILQAVTGLMSVTGTPESGPCKVQTPVIDMATGYQATICILAALQERQRSGQGQSLDVNMYGASLALQQLAMTSFLATSKTPKPCGSAAPYAAPNEALRCADGWIMVAAYHPQRWKALCEVIGAPQLLSDSRFADNADRVRHRGALIAEIEARLVHHTREHWLQAMMQADIICGPILDYAEVLSSDQTAFYGLLEEVQHPVAGTVRLPRSMLAACGERPRTQRPPPTFGQHTQEVLAELQQGGDRLRT